MFLREKIDRVDSI